MEVMQYFKEYLSNYRAYRNYWNYEDGLILIGCQQMYEATKDEFFKKFILDYVNPLVEADGTIDNYNKEKHCLESTKSGKILFFLYNETKEEKYYKAIEYIMEQIRLDDLLMALPFYMSYETVFNKKENYNDIIGRFVDVRKYIFDNNKQLGWYLMALIDTMDAMSIEIFEAYKTLEVLFKEAVKVVLQNQDARSKMFYQVVDTSDVKENDSGTSEKSIIAYAILKGCKLGVLSEEKYKVCGEEILSSLVREKMISNANTTVLNVTENDPKGVGVFMMAYATSLMKE